MTKFLVPLAFIFISQMAGIIGSIFTAPAIPNWYATLNKPSFNPPGWIFGPVWLTLYTLMGLAAYFVWLKWGSSTLAKTGVILFFVHLIINALWSYFFFGLQNPLLALFTIAILWIMIVALIIIFYQVNRNSAYMMIPYLLWVSFASVLNFYIWRLN